MKILRDWLGLLRPTSVIWPTGDKIERHKVEGYPYFPRTETCGFGVKR